VQLDPPPHFVKFKTPKSYRKFVKKISASDYDEQTRIAFWKHLLKNDLFFLLRYGLRRKDTDNDWYLARCREVQLEPNGCIDLWGREHGKSSVLTFALTIQDILNDAEITVGIFSHTRPIAKSFLRQIKRELESNELLKKLFPEVLYAKPESESPQWSEDGGITVRRKGNTKEATVEAWGLVDGMPTGRHFKLRVYDDVVTRENVTTAEQIEKTTEAFELSDNLGSIGGTFRIIGTRYHLNDTYASILKKGVAKPRIYPATINGRMDGKPVYFSQELWDYKKKVQSRKIVAAQLLQNPLADEDARFQPLWLTSYEIRPLILNVYIMGDPSLGRHKESDNTAIVVVGYSAGGTKYLLDGYCHRMALSERWKRLKELYQKWSSEIGVQSIDVGWERYGLQSDQEYFEERQRIEEVYFAIKELNWSQNSAQSKPQRIDRLEPDFRNRRLLLPAPVWHDGQAKTWSVDSDPESKLYQSINYKEFIGLSKKQQEMLEGGQSDLLAKAIKRVDNEREVYDLTVKLIDEYTQFPFASHDDILDALSRFYDMEAIEPVSYTRVSTDPPIFVDS
jgi:hypothetical protein